VEVTEILFLLEDSLGAKDQLFVWSLVSVAQMSTVRKIQTHKSVMGLHDGLVHLQVCWASRQGLDIDTPLLVVEAKCLESTSLAEKLNGVDMLVATIVTSTWVTLRVLVGHGGAQSVKDGAGGDILRGDEEDGLALALDFLLLQSLSV
jgi:hypothetical protein